MHCRKMGMACSSTCSSRLRKAVEKCGLTSGIVSTAGAGVAASATSTPHSRSRTLCTGLAVASAERATYGLFSKTV